ncbi:MAG TPA: hypothetical protein VFR86_00490 [Burkholderiaceae bacterium]|nr:hypothetical protein [Burkholderiaceae bacterium]
MQLRPEIQIKSVLKAMTDVILPALDPANPLAQEQARLCIGHLSVIAARLSLQYRYDLDELGRLLALTRRVQQLPGADALAPRSLTALADSARRGANAFARARAEPAELVEAVRALRAATGKLVQEAFENDPSGRTTDELQRVVMDASREQLVRERAWLKVQGWEADPDAIPAIETLLEPVQG